MLRDPEEFCGEVEFEAESGCRYSYVARVLPFDFRDCVMDATRIRYVVDGKDVTREEFGRWIDAQPESEHLSAMRAEFYSLSN